jgi:hypothetical protein
VTRLDFLLKKSAKNYLPGTQLETIFNEEAFEGTMIKIAPYIEKWERDAWPEKPAGDVRCGCGER